MSFIFFCVSTLLSRERTAILIFASPTDVACLICMDMDDSPPRSPCSSTCSAASSHCGRRNDAELYASSVSSADLSPAYSTSNARFRQSSACAIPSPNPGGGLVAGNVRSSGGGMTRGVGRRPDSPRLAMGDAGAVARARLRQLVVWGDAAEEARDQSVQHEVEPHCTEEGKDSVSAVVSGERGTPLLQGRLSAQRLLSMRSVGVGSIGIGNKVKGDGSSSETTASLSDEDDDDDENEEDAVLLSRLSRRVAVGDRVKPSVFDAAGDGYCLPPPLSRRRSLFATSCRRPDSSSSNLHLNRNPSVSTVPSSHSPSPSCTSPTSSSSSSSCCYSSPLRPRSMWWNRSSPFTSVLSPLSPCSPCTCQNRVSMHDHGDECCGKSSSTMTHANEISTSSSRSQKCQNSGCQLCTCHTNSHNHKTPPLRRLSYRRPQSFHRYARIVPDHLANVDNHYLSSTPSTLPVHNYTRRRSVRIATLPSSAHGVNRSVRAEDEDEDDFDDLVDGLHATKVTETLVHPGHTPSR